MNALIDVPAAYDRIAEKFLADRSTTLREKKYLDVALAGVRPGSPVLDFGCGTGRPIGEHLAACGFEVTGVDGSAGMLKLAREILPTARLIHARLEDVELTDTFSAAVAWDSLFHIDREHHAGIYRKLAHGLAPGGRLLLSNGGTADAGFTGEMHGHTFFYSSWSPEEAESLLEAAGLTVELCEFDQTEGRGHVAIVARKSR
jgi:cyclopropane fatty-acyl-phospholipid synthase-like methyltransferase